ncbi:Hypothetical predicted protein [Pelobates cultripes]|uniref:Transposase n=1 Tax=Pelobates cultripes TaxID=61616 RepID=A0AAD1WTL6_PELCU|nr:Hypothetical predicted protein [Pelobates cultripes]
MSSRRPPKKRGTNKAPSVVDMFAAQRPAARGAPTNTSPSTTHRTDPLRTQDSPPEASSSAILQSLADAKGYLAEEIKRSAKEVKAEIAAIGARTTWIELQIGNVVQAHNRAVDLTNTLLTRVTDLELELEDVSNRSRRNNLRIRGLPDSVGEADLEETRVTCFKQSLPDIPEHLWIVDRVHRALRARGPKNSPTPRDVIMKWHYYKTK